MNTIKLSEAEFKNSLIVDFQKNRKLFWLVNGLSLPLFAVFYLLFHYVFWYTGVIQFRNPLIYFKAIQFLPLSGDIIFIAGVFTVMILHELIHGLFFFLYTKDKPVFGFKSLFAYAGAPGWYIKKSRFLVISLSPVTILTFIGLLSCLFLPIKFMAIVFIITSVNAAGSLGDIWMSFILLKKPEETYVHDTGISATISYN